MTCTYFILAGLSVSCVRAFFPGRFSIVPPDRRLRVSGSMHADGVAQTLKWAHRCTSNKISYTLPVCQEEKGLEKKSFSLHPDRVHSDPPSVSSSVLPSSSQTCGSASPLLSAHQWEITLWKHRMSRFTSWSVQVLPWPRAGKRFMRRCMPTLDTVFEMSPPQTATLWVKENQVGWGGWGGRLRRSPTAAVCDVVVCWSVCVCLCLCAWVLVKVNLWGWT